MALKAMGLNKVGELGHFIRDQRRNARLSLRKLSNMAGVSNPYLSQIERGLRRPSAEILQSIAKALRISAETLYVKAGILDERDDSIDPVTSLLRDLNLTEKQKQVMIEIYQSFRHENELEGAESAAPRPATKVAAARKPAPKKPAPKKAAPKKQAPKSRSTKAKTSTKKKATAKKSPAKKTPRKTAARATKAARR